MNYFNELCDDVLVVGKIEVETTTRLGQYNALDNKPRPLRIKLKNKNDKTRVFSRLANLKDAGNKFCKISLADDLYIKEREEIKSLVQEAKNWLSKNVSEQSQGWKF